MDDLVDYLAANRQWNTQEEHNRRAYELQWYLNTQKYVILPPLSEFKAKGRICAYCRSVKDQAKCGSCGASHDL